MRIKILFLLLFSHCLFAQNFTEKEVIFKNQKKGFELSATLATPTNLSSFPVVVLITGSGQTDRDETLFGTKFFKTISDHLASNGIGVLRYDDRGGYKSKGPKTAFSTQQEMASDASAAVKFLRKTHKFKNIGIIGHSEGGGLAPMVNKKYLKFIISLSGPAVKGADVLIKQNEIIYKKLGADPSKVDDYIKYYFAPLTQLSLQNLDSTTYVTSASAIIDKYHAEAKDIPFIFTTATQKTMLGVIEDQLNSIWFKSMLSTNYTDYWNKTKVPALALFAEKDVQVDAEINIKALEKLQKPNIQIKTLPEHNHLYQIAKTGNTDEYMKLKTSVSMVCLNTVVDFIQRLKK